MSKIKKLVGREILDSRGNPTVLAVCELDDGVSASASVPSGASTGTAEACELRDGDPKRYRGQGCQRAAANISGVLSQAVMGREFSDQSELDEMMIALDGTPKKARLGANAILAVSVAFARACASPSIFLAVANMLASRSPFRTFSWFRCLRRPWTPLWSQPPMCIARRQ